MNSLKKMLGVLWMMMGPGAIGFLVYQASRKLGSVTATTNDWLQWGIIILIFLPIALGFVIFGFYSMKGEYDMD